MLNRTDHVVIDCLLWVFKKSTNIFAILSVEEIAQRHGLPAQRLQLLFDAL